MVRQWEHTALSWRRERKRERNREKQKKLQGNMRTWVRPIVLCTWTRTCTLVDFFRPSFLLRLLLRDKLINFFPLKSSDLLPVLQLHLGVDWINWVATVSLSTGVSVNWVNSRVLEPKVHCAVVSLSLSLAFSLFLLSSQVARSVCDLYSVLMKQSPEADCVQVVREGKREEERSSEGKTSWREWRRSRVKELRERKRERRSKRKREREK